MPRKDKVIDALTRLSFNEHDPLPKFKRFAKLYDGDLSDNRKFYEPLYPDFVDYNVRHQMTTIEPVYLNDFDFNIEEDRIKLIQLIRSDFDSETFSSMARCQCPPERLNRLVGNYLERSGIICEMCQCPVTKQTETELSTKVWVRKPDGVDTFINPGFYQTYLKRIETATPKIEIIRLIIDPTYLRVVKNSIAQTERQRAVADNPTNRKYPPRINKLNEVLDTLAKLNVELSINGFYRNADLIMDYFLRGPGFKLIALDKVKAARIYEHYERYKHLMFCDYLPVPNKLTVIVEHNAGGSDPYAVSTQLKSNALFESIADTKSASENYTLTEEDINESLLRVGKAIPRIAELRAEDNKVFAFKKQSVFRKNVSSGSLLLTGRSVITSVTGIIDPNRIRIPWVMALAQLTPFIISHLYRLGYSPQKADRLMAEATRKIVPEIDEFFAFHEKNNDIICKSGRMPSIQYLSRRAFYASINRDLEDESIGLPITTVSAYNADFDGDQMTVFFQPDLRAKALAYGAWGHQTSFDENTPFKISRHMNQPATNLVNLNSIMRSTEFK